MALFEQSAPGEFSRVVSTSVYSRHAVFSAQSAFKRHCAVTVRPIGHDEILVTVRPIGEGLSTALQAVLEFWNFVLDTEAQRRLGVK